MQNSRLEDASVHSDLGQCCSSIHLFLWMDLLLQHIVSLYLNIDKYSMLNVNSFDNHAKNIFIVGIYTFKPPANYLPTDHIIVIMCIVHRI